MPAKKVLLALLIVFVGFWMITDPNGLADAAKTGAQSAWGLMVQLFGALINFFGAL